MGIDIAIVCVYLAGVVWLGVKVSRGKTMQDFFLGGRRIHWLLASLSIVATETSALTVISLPGLGYTSGMGFLQIAFGYLVGRIIVSFVFLPGYLDGNYFTVYQFLEKSFGSGTKKTVSVIFHFTRVLADGVRLFATSIPLTFIMGWDYRISIALIALATLAYTLYGGIGSVVVTDAVQLIVYLAAALLALAFLIISFDDAGSAVEIAHRAFFDIIQWEGVSCDVFFSYNIVSGIIGGAFVSLGSHGVDHLIVQRALSVRDLSSARKAIISSGIFVIVQFALFLFLGLLIREALGARIFARSDDMMPYFIVHHLPTGLRGVFLAGIFASAMSTISSSINSLSSSSCIDLLELDKAKHQSQGQLLWISRAVSLGWASALVLAAIAFNFSTKALVEVALSIASVTYGGVLGVFFMERFFKRFSGRTVLAGMIAGIAASAFVAMLTPINWLFYIAVGCGVSIAVAALLAFFSFIRLGLR